MSTKPKIVSREGRMLHQYLEVTFISFVFFIYVTEKQHTTVSPGASNNLQSKLIKMTKKE